MPVTFGMDSSKEFDPELNIEEQAELDGHFLKESSTATLDETDVTEDTDAEADYAALMGEVSTTLLW